jgi:hypothetical protein
LRAKFKGVNLLDVGEEAVVMDEQFGRGWEALLLLKLIPSYEVDGGLLKYKPATILVVPEGTP